MNDKAFLVLAKSKTTKKLSIILSAYPGDRNDKKGFFIDPEIINAVVPGEKHEKNLPL